MDFDYLDGCFYTVKDVVESPKFIALKGGYYICYPFMALEVRGGAISMPSGKISTQRILETLKESLLIMYIRNVTIYQSIFWFILPKSPLYIFREKIQR